MSVVTLRDEENVAILAESFTESLAALRDRARQVAVLKRIATLLSSSTPRHFIYEEITGCSDLEVVRVGDDRRLFCRLVTGVPDGNARYNILFVFYVDTHDYRTQQLQRLDDVARRRLREIASLEGVEDVETYLEDQHAFTAADIDERIDHLQD